MKQSAIEWLVEKFDLEFRFENFKEEINKAKEMEKQQIIDAWANKRYIDYPYPTNEAEQYYNETFNK